MKTCTKCKIEKEFTEFNKQRKTKDGLTYACKPCRKEYDETNKERIKEYRKEYYKNNKEREKEYYKNNKEKVKECNKQYSKTNKEYFKEYRENNKEYFKEYREKNKERAKEYKKNNKKRRNELRRERRKVDPLFKMTGNLRTRTSLAFKNKGYSKNTKTQEMLGVDWEVCKAHIERQFTKGMKWSNQGEWHIDHIIPLASAKTEEGLKKLCHYSNLQPLWAEDNLIKSDKIIGQQNKLRL
jgi:hypothetical protein